MPVVREAGGHLIAAAGLVQVILCYDYTRHSSSMVLKVPAIGTIVSLRGVLPSGIDAAVLGIGNPDIRGRLLTPVQERGWSLPCLIHSTAMIAAGTLIGEGTMVDAGVEVGARPRIGAASIVEAGSSIPHDAVVGDLVHVEAGVRIMSGARIGAGAVAQRKSNVDEGGMIRRLTVVDGFTGAVKRGVS